MPSTHTSLTGLGHWKGDSPVSQQLFTSLSNQLVSWVPLSLSHLCRDPGSGGNKCLSHNHTALSPWPHLKPGSLNAEPAHAPHPGHGACGFTYFSAYLAFLSLPEALTSPCPGPTQDYPPSTALLSLPISLLV